MTIKPLIHLVIEDLISLSSLPILICLFYHGDGQNKEKWCQVTQKKPNSQCIKELRNANHQEEQVEKVFELVKEHNWKEGDETVLLIVYLVVGNASENIVKVVEFD